MNSHILVRPIVTEKSIKDAEKRKFTFQVSEKAGKNAIKEAIEKAFNVNVTSITTTTGKGRSMRTGKKRVELSLSNVKKATVRLKENQTIALFETGGR
jgi:large subunit ribosomal protein L23